MTEWIFRITHQETVDLEASSCQLPAALLYQCHPQAVTCSIPVLELLTELPPLMPTQGPHPAKELLCRLPSLPPIARSLSKVLFFFQVHGDGASRLGCGGGKWESVSLARFQCSKQLCTPTPTGVLGAAPSVASCPNKHIAGHWRDHMGGVIGLVKSTPCAAPTEDIIHLGPPQVVGRKFVQRRLLQHLERAGCESETGKSIRSAKSWAGSCPRLHEL